MANILGKLFIELGVNSAAFSEGLTKATYATQKFGKDVRREFSDLGQSLTVMAGAFGAFGPAGAALASAISLAGQAAGSAITKFSGLSKTFGVLSGAAAGAAAGLASLSIATIGMVVKTSDEILHEMERQAQSAGVNVTEFSRLAYATRVLGLDQETLVKGLQRMNRAALMAAEGGKQQQFAFQILLGSGAEFQNMLRTGTVNLQALADGFNRVQDPQMRSALAMQVFGRAGAELVPLLNQGREGLARLSKEADALGVTVSEKAAKDAAALTMNLIRMKEAMTGVAILITSQLAPAFVNMSNEIVSDMEAPNSKLKEFASGLADVVKVLMTIGKIVVAVFETVGKSIGHAIGEMVAEVEMATSVMGQLIHGHFKQAFQSITDDSKIMLQQMADDGKDVASSWENLNLGAIWKDQIKEAEKEVPKMKAGPGIAIPSTTPATAESDQVRKFIADLEAQADASKKLAATINETVGAQAMLNAQDEAAEGISRQRAEIQMRIDQLTTQINENANSYSAQQRANYEAEISQLKSYEKELDANRQKIVDLYATIAAGKEAKSATQGLEAETMKYTERIKALQTELAALASGHPFKTQSADLANDLEKVKELQDALAEAQKLYGNNSDAVKELTAALATANAELAKHREQLEQIDALQQKETDLKKAQEAAQQAANEKLREEREVAKRVMDTFAEGMARAIVTGKENFRQLFAGIEESLIKTGITNLFHNLGQGIANIHKPGGFGGGLAPHGAGPLGIIGGLLGFGGKGRQPGSSPMNPMYTKDAGSIPGLGGKDGAAGGLAGMIPGLSGGGGGIFGKIFGFASMFAGFLAGGGDVTPGRAYVVGEKHPEFFVPRAPGTVATRLNIESGRSSQNSVTINTHIEALDSSSVEDIIHLHKQAVTDAVTSGLRARGVY